MNKLVIITIVNRNAILTVNILAYTNTNHHNILRIVNILIIVYNTKN